MTEKKCTRCEKVLPLSGYYTSKGKTRSECKSCTVKRNVRYQRRVKSWKRRQIDKETANSYMITYYHKNKDRFAEYRRKFKEKHPNYYKDYARNAKLSPL